MEKIKLNQILSGATFLWKGGFFDYASQLGKIRLPVSS